ncbi:MAG: hypothetical protein HOK72_10370 [Flavobacteriales bacterium]|jgi:hypothetical protein|nr:hypothetical protein [Flavobacteriales bacterium]MBT6440095.1 hypothetical protein [Flavobacteriales bacterium]
MKTLALFFMVLGGMLVFQPIANAVTGLNSEITSEVFDNDCDKCKDDKCKDGKCEKDCKKSCTKECKKSEGSCTHEHKAEGKCTKKEKKCSSSCKKKEGGK